MTAPTCATCRWAKSTAISHALKYECRRMPPTADTHQPYYYAFPLMDSDDWCGEHAPKSDP